MTYDLIIIGGGPAGTAAGVYAARKKLKTLLIASEFGGQSTVSPDIQNWIGDVAISGDDLAKKFKAHLEAYKDDVLELKSGEAVTKVEKSGDDFTVTTDKESYEAKTVLVTTGAHRRKLTVPGAEEFDQKGLTYCASCDGPVFAGQDVVVIGGGNAAFESAMQLLAYTKSVTLLNRRDTFRADEITVERVRAHPNMTIITGVEPAEVTGEKFVTGLSYKNTATGEVNKLDVTGIFVEIGLIPTTGFMKDIIDINKFGYIEVDPKTQRASVSGIWAAGDCADGLYHQNNIAAGDAVKALEDIYIYLQKEK